MSVLENAVLNSDIIVIGADHKEFKEINPEEIASKMRNKKIYDTKNIIDKDKWEKAGFKVIKIGDYSDYDWQKKYGINY